MKKALVLLPAVLLTVACTGPKVRLKNDLPEDHQCNPVTFNYDGESIETAAGEEAEFAVVEGDTEIVTVPAKGCTVNGTQNPEAASCTIKLKGFEVGLVTASPSTAGMGGMGGSVGMGGMGGASPEVEVDLDMDISTECLP